MTEEAEQGPDPNGVRRHAKRMYTEMEYRRKYRRLDFYRPNRKQLEFHCLAVPEKMLRGGNQEGKTHGAAAELAMDACAVYPEWHKGRQFLIPPKIERPFEFLAWAGCTTSSTTRDGVQMKLIGDIREEGGLGTGMIPLDNIVGRPTMARGIADFVDTIAIRRETGGKGLIRLKTFEMERRAWQGEAVDKIWLDEDSGEDVIYGECAARMTTTAGQIMVTMTPVLGLTPVRRRFKDKHPGTQEVLLTLDDALVSNGGHIPDDQKEIILARYKDSERQTRAYGADMQGEGAVFATPVDAIKHNLDPVDVPPHWPWLWAFDFRHSGSATSGHPFAAVLGTWDRDTDRIYVMHAIRMLGLAEGHVKAIKEHPMKEAPVAWPHDGGRGGSLLSGETLSQVYKKLGSPWLNMRPTHATFAAGGFNFEAGLFEMETRFANKRLLIARHLTELFDEYQGYHRVNGLVHKVDDDLLSAIRVLVMDIRYAKTPREFHAVRLRDDRRGISNFARGTAGNDDMDPFTGT